MTLAAKIWQITENRLMEWAYLGTRTVSNGARLIGHVPHVAPEAWLHTLYAPLNKDEIKSIEDALKQSIHSSYAEFLGYSNGAKIFSDSISLWGLRANYDRTPDGARQPYDLVALNLKSERPKGMPDNVIVIGGYRWDGSKICLFPDGVVVRSIGSTFQPKDKWDSVWKMLEIEVARLSKMYDQLGRKNGQPTIPS